MMWSDMNVEYQTYCACITVLRWYYSSAHIKCPPNFQPQYLSLILMEMRIQHHFRNPQAISFPMVPDFTQID